jgi:zinc/manganese transport system substrate-binding protein
MLRLVAWSLCAVLIVSPARAENLDVVASFSILADFVRNVGGDKVKVTSLVGPNSDVHVYTPAPSDAKTVAAAQLVVINGLGLEGWLPRLLQSSGSKAPVVVATKGITPLKLGSAADPHAWQWVANAKTYVANIRNALTEADPADAEVFKSNAEAYLAKLDALDDEIGPWVASIPSAQRKLITTHDAFGYFAKAYGLEFIAPQSVSTETEPGARDVAAIIAQIKRDRVPAVFIENISDDRLIGRIAAETGARIGGKLFSDSLTDEKGDAPTYIDMMRHNIRTLRNALGGPPLVVR